MTAGIPVFGPSPAASLLEGSKALSKAFMARHNIPTAGFACFTQSQNKEAFSYLETCGFERVVIKASGLAGGKGVLIPETMDEAKNALQSVMIDNSFGSAGEEVVIEEYLTGPELSILSFCDGYTFKSLPGAQDHKRIGEGDEGLNTGGMGAYAPAPCGTEEIISRLERECLAPTLKGMREEGESNHLSSTR
jgi:phosphoribosylamine--glycine ligase/phosphoribosylformylglycinamidine cyclo-ligase